MDYKQISSEGKCIFITGKRILRLTKDLLVGWATGHVIYPLVIYLLPSLKERLKGKRQMTDK